jgi:hypothetical protein
MKKITDPDDITVCHRYETRLIEARRVEEDARNHRHRLRQAYREHIADLIGRSVDVVELTSTLPCVKGINHCVYDLSDTHWPCCVFCGSPKYGC